jgi:xanthine dehydrogenase FAD-binding subunit
MYDIEHYVEAVSVEDAIEHLKADPDATVISGGTDVLVRLRSGKGVGGTLVSIHEIPELHGVDRLLNGTLVIGPATCFTDLAKDPLIRSCVPYLGEAVETVGGPPDPEYGHDRRKSLQRRDQRGFRSRDADAERAPGSAGT